MMYYIGIDVSNQTFTVSKLLGPDTIIFYGKDFDNTPEGFRALETLIPEKDEHTIVLEATGVYGERLCLYFRNAGYRVCAEPPQHVKRAFRLKRKSDKVDSKMIAEYGFRYADKLHTWQPRSPIYEDIVSLLNSREMMIRQQTSHKNILKALNKKGHLPASITQHQAALDYLQQAIRDADTLLKRILLSDPDIAQHIINLKSMPGVGDWWAANFFVISNGFQNLNYRKLACYLGIVPHEFTSGTSVRKKARSDREGSDRMRKALYLSSMSVVRLDGKLKKQYLETVVRGKPKRLAQNNIAVKMLKIACAIVRDGKAYEPTHKSVNPLLIGGKEK